MNVICKLFSIDEFVHLQLITGIQKVQYSRSGYQNHASNYTLILIPAPASEQGNVIGNAIGFVSVYIGECGS